MRIISTGDVALEDLRKLSAELGPDFQVEVDERQMFFKSGTPPSWVAFLADAPLWLKILELYAGVYVAEIVKEAGKETWKNRGKILSATAAGAKRIKDFAGAVGRLRSRLPSKTKIEVGLPIPDDTYGTRLELLGKNEDELAVELAGFVDYVPALTELIRKEGLNRGTVAVGIEVELLPDGAMEVSWQDNDSLKKQTRILKRGTTRRKQTGKRKGKGKGKGK